MQSSHSLIFRSFDGVLAKNKKQCKNKRTKKKLAYLRGDEIIFDWVDVKIDEDILMNIADRTGGKYFRATNAEKLGDIYEEIDVLEKTRFNVLRYQRKTEAYIGFLLIALGALLLEKVLSFTLIKSIS